MNNRRRRKSPRNSPKSKLKLPLKNVRCFDLYLAHSLLIATTAATAAKKKKKHNKKKDNKGIFRDRQS